MKSRAPVCRWDTTEARGAFASAAYGAFVAQAAFGSNPKAFQISRTEARTLDPMVMLVLETSYCVFLDSQISSRCRASLINSLVGFFLGVGGSISASGQQTSKQESQDADASSVYAGTSGALSVLSGRVSYALGLTGPCLTTDTACSSSLVAIHLAASALTLVECERSAVAGVAVLTGLVTAAFSAAGMLSALGRSHTFDRRADGYCRAEGCGGFLLTPA